MKKFPWTEESVSLMCRAAERSGFHALLAEKIGAYLTGTESVYEPGCGTGDLSLALSKYVPSLTAADIDPLPLKALRERAEKRGVNNLTVREEDAFSLPEDIVYDAAVFCYFGMPEQILAFSRAHVKKDVFVIKRAYAFHRFSEGMPVTGDSLSSMCALLEKEGVAYEKELLECEMGQPLKDLSEARLFFSLYGRDEPDLSDEALLARLMKTDDSEYPYYVPGLKRVGLIHFQAEAL